MLNRFTGARMDWELLVLSVSKILAALPPSKMESKILAALPPLEIKWGYLMLCPQYDGGAVGTATKAKGEISINSSSFSVLSKVSIAHMPSEME
jgi:hypothetical protein